MASSHKKAVSRAPTRITAKSKTIQPKKDVRMTDDTMTQSGLEVNLKGIAFLEREGEFLFSSEEIGKQLGYAYPAQSLTKLYNRNIEELQHYSVEVKMTSTDGKCYQVRHFTELGLYTISMLANTEKARNFRKSVAAFLQEHRMKMKALEVEAACTKAVEEALALPAVQAREKAAFYKGMKEASNPRKDRLAKVRRAWKLIQEKGLTLSEAAQLVRMGRTTLADQLHALGLRIKGKTRGIHVKKAHIHTMTNGEV